MRHKLIIIVALFLIWGTVTYFVWDAYKATSDAILGVK